MKKKLLFCLAMFPAVGLTAAAVYGVVVGLTWEVLLLAISVPIGFIAGILCYEIEK